VVPARKVTKASGTTFAKGPEKIMAANATVPRTVMTLDNAAKDRSARTSCAVNCLPRIASTMPNIATSRQPEPGHNLTLTSIAWTKFGEGKKFHIAVI
jgi:hypothetical protein